MICRKHEDDREVVRSVARRLGEAVVLVRQRGFHVVEADRYDDEPDVVDMAELTGGLDWDRDIEPRLHCRRDNRKQRVA
jgi:hypothetical protein